MESKKYKLLENKLRKMIREELESGQSKPIMEGFRDLSLYQQSKELENLFKKKFKTIHFGDTQKIGSMQQFIFIEENDDESVLKSALSYIKSVVSMGGRVGEYEDVPAIILFYA